MLRLLLWTLAMPCLLVACSDSSTTSEPTTIPAPKKVEPAPVAPTHPPEGVQNPQSPASHNVVPGRGSIFVDQQSCVQAGYSVDQCQSAWSVAAAMSASTDNLFATQAECQAYFSACEARVSSEDRTLFSPKMGGFSLGSEVPGIDRQPSVQSPVFYVPVYKNQKGEWVYTVLDEKGVSRSFKVGQ